MLRNGFTIRFAKFHGLDNDFIVARARGLPPNLAKVAKAITHRHSGIGADGFLVVSKPRNPTHDAAVRFFNADGSEAEMSGNGIRCVGAFLLPAGSRPRSLQIETLAGVKTLEPLRIPAKQRRGDWIFRVSMGEPIFNPNQIPFKGKATAVPVVGFPLRVRGSTLRVTVISMGNPHCSVFVRNFDLLDWRSLGARIERHRLFPRRTNVEFIRVVSSQKIEVRFWERGVGETVSSGTGSCAAAVGAMLNGFVKRAVRVQTTAGSLHVDWRSDGQVLLTGPSAEIAGGTFYC